MIILIGVDCDEQDLEVQEKKRILFKNILKSGNNLTHFAQH